MESEEEHKQLLRDAMRGSRAAFCSLARGWYGRIYALCYSRLAVHQDAEDAVQETFVRVYCKLREIRDTNRFGAWIRGIAYNICTDILRDRYRRSQLLRSAGEPTSATTSKSAEELFEGSEERREIWSEVNSLPEALREVVLLHYFESMSYDQMAHWIGVARSTVQERLARARQVLRQSLLRKWRIPYERVQ